MNNKLLSILLITISLFLITGCNKHNIEKNSTIKKEENQMIIEVNDKELIVKLENNSSVKALLEKLKKGNIIINAADYGNFEKVGDLGFELPTNDEQVNVKSGDLMLYQGNKITLFYNNNSWSYTKIGKVINVSEDELKNILGEGNVTLVLK